MKRLLLLLVLSGIFTASGQVQISRYVIGSTGTVAKAGALDVSFTVGEPAVTTVESGAVVLTQGFQQPANNVEDIDGIKVYNGITPNADGTNDIWIIDGINRFPENEVSIFNRWGQQLWSRPGYDNYSVYWDGTNEAGEELVDGTYFYLISFGDGKVRKGWVQLTR